MSHFPHTDYSEEEFGTRVAQKKIFIFTALLSLLWLLLSGMHLSSLHEIKLAALRDESGLKQIDDISSPEQANNFIECPYGFARGYTRDVHWVRFTIDPKSKQSQESEIYLEIQPPYLDDIQLFWPDPNAVGGYRLYKNGGLIPSAERTQRYRAFINKVKFNNDLPHTAYIRLKTTSSTIMFVRSWSTNEFTNTIQVEYLWIGLFSGLLISSLISNIWIGLWKKHALYRAYLLYVLNTFLTLLLTSGIHNVLWPSLPANVGHHGISILFITMITSGLYFYRQALDLEHSYWPIKWANRITFYGSLIALPAPFLDLYPETARILIPAMLTSLIFNLLRILQLKRNNKPDITPVLTAHLFSLSGHLTAGLTLLGFFPSQAWLIYSYQASMLGMISALQWMMMQRTKTLEKNQIYARISIEKARAQADYERAEREQQRRFLAMLTHELKTPLSVLRLYMGSPAMSERMRPHAISSIHSINALIERCGLVSSIDEKRVNYQIQECSINTLLKEISTQFPTQTINIDTPELPVIFSDALLLKIIMSNLLENAIKYTNDINKISVSAFTETRLEHVGILLIIKNPIGPAGLPDANQLFDKYYRSPGARAQAGSGLGLYIVKELCILLQSEIHYFFTDSEACFELWIPQKATL